MKGERGEIVNVLFIKCWTDGSRAEEVLLLNALLRCELWGGRRIAELHPAGCGNHPGGPALLCTGHFLSGPPRAGGDRS